MRFPALPIALLQSIQNKNAGKLKTHQNLWDELVFLLLSASSSCSLFQAHVIPCRWHRDNTG